MSSRLRALIPILVALAVLAAGAWALSALTGGSGGTGDDALVAAERTAARQAKNWAEADRIRTVLQDAGIVLEDTAKGTLWRRE